MDCNLINLLSSLLLVPLCLEMSRSLLGPPMPFEIKYSGRDFDLSTRGTCESPRRSTLFLASNFAYWCTSYRSYNFDRCSCCCCCCCRRHRLWLFCCSSLVVLIVCFGTVIINVILFSFVVVFCC